MADQTTLDQLGSTASTALVSDALDALGVHGRVIRAPIRRLAGSRRLIGRAATMLAGQRVSPSETPYEMQIAATDGLDRGDVIVASTQGVVSCAFWGELFTTAAIARGAHGAVIDGLVRDVRHLERLDFPVFATGTLPIDSMNRLAVLSYGEPIKLGGVTVYPGDVVFADEDGIVAIPQHVEDSAVEVALDKATKEDAMRDDLRAGVPLAQAWQKHRVL